MISRAVLGNGGALSLVTFLKEPLDPMFKNKGQDENGKLYIIKKLLQAVLEKFKNSRNLRLRLQNNNSRFNYIVSFVKKLSSDRYCAGNQLILLGPVDT